MKYLVNALRAELLKTKRTLAFWLALIAPAVIVGLQVLIVYDRREMYLARASEYHAWLDYGGETLVMWSLLMLPLFITLETALVAQWEHRARQWKHLFALPVPRGVLYAAKQIAGMLLIGLSSLVLVALIVLTGLGFRLAVPGLGFEAPIPMGDYLKFVGIMFLGAWLLMAIQTWVAQRWSSFTVASAVGIALTIAGVVAVQSDYGPYYPTTLPLIVASKFVESLSGINMPLDMPIKALAFGILGGVLVTMLAGWDMARRDVL